MTHATTPPTGWTPRRAMLEDWLARARVAKSLRHDEPWPAWSTGETLAVALILDDATRLADEDYTRAEALERLRHEIGEPTVAAAGAVFAQLRDRLAAE